MSKESIEGPLTALRNAGTVCGVCLARSTEVVVNLFPFSAKRVEEIVTVIDDILLHFQKSGREVDQLCFGYDGGNLVIVTDDDYRLVVMHMHPDEIDFIAKAARAFLVDFQVGLFAEQLAGRDVRLPELTNGVRIEPIRNEPEAESDNESGDPERPADPEGGTIALTPSQPKVETTSIPISPKKPAPAPAPAAPAASPATVSPRPMRPPAAAAVAVAPAATTPGGEGESEAEGEEEDDVQGPRLAPNQPESTLPPPRVPKARGDS